MRFILFLFFISCCSTGWSQDSVNAKAGSAEVLSEASDMLDSAAKPAETSAWEKFLRRQIDYDTPHFNGAPRGVYVIKVKFIVQADGKLSGFQALTKHGYGMEREVIRALKKSPPWTPAVQNGKPVNVYRVQEVVFGVEY